MIIYRKNFNKKFENNFVFKAQFQAVIKLFTDENILFIWIFVYILKNI